LWVKVEIFLVSSTQASFAFASETAVEDLGGMKEAIEMRVGYGLVEESIQQSMLRPFCLAHREEGIKNSVKGKVLETCFVNVERFSVFYYHVAAGGRIRK
jgi:hypothetical protein